MAILNISDLRARAAAESKRCREANLRLVLLYCGVLALLTLGSGVLNLVLDSQIGQTGGLNGLGMRAVWQTVQEVLYYVNYFFGPFWTAGFLYAMLGMVRGGTPKGADLTAGFRRFGRVLAHMAFGALVFAGMMIASAYLAAILFAFSSRGAAFVEMLLPLIEDPNLITPEGIVNMELIPAEALELAQVPMLVLTSVVFLPSYLYLTLGFRMSLYLVMEGQIGGARAYSESMRLMRGHKWQLLKLDLSYWWYYVLMMAVYCLSRLDLILPMAGITLPLDPNMLYFLAIGVYCLADLGLSMWKKCEVNGAYLLAYEAIAHPEQESAECTAMNAQWN